jgi:hypothetical protein
MLREGEGEKEGGEGWRGVREGEREEWSERREREENGESV